LNCVVLVQEEFLGGVDEAVVKASEVVVKASEAVVKASEAEL
jgi:hypothetical protein